MTEAALAPMWRLELLHPAIVHFPIALTLVGALFWLAARVAGNKPAMRWLDLAAAALLVLAAASAWLAVLAGDWADSRVVRTLFDPRVLEAHENRAILLAALLTATALLNLFRAYQFCGVRLSATAGRIATAFTGLLLIICCGLLAHVAHLGASLVYQQGAAVIMPADQE